MKQTRHYLLMEKEIKYNEHSHIEAQVEVDSERSKLLSVRSETIEAEMIGENRFKIKFKYNSGKSRTLEITWPVLEDLYILGCIFQNVEGWGKPGALSRLVELKPEDNLL